MRSSLRRAGTFIGCYIGCAVVGSVFVAPLVNLFASVDAETAALISKLSVLAGVIPALLIAKYLNTLYAKRTARRLLEKEWERWMSQQYTKKSVCAARSTGDPKDACSANFDEPYVSRQSIHPFRPIPAT